MENATKALIMAGGMLITILIVSLSIAAYNAMTNSARTNQESLSQEQVAEFNSQFEVYNREDLLGIELVSILNKVNDYNSKYESEGYNKINTNLKNIIDSGKDENGDITSEFKGSKFRCTGITYDQKTGQVTSINFEKK